VAVQSSASGRGSREQSLSLECVRRIQQRYRSLSAGQRAAANYLLTNADQAAFLTAEEVAAAAGVSDSTVVRLAISLGYSGYGELHRSFKSQVKKKLTTLDRWMHSRIRLKRDGAVLRQVVESDIVNMQAMLRDIPENVLERAVTWMAEAPTVYVAGMRTAFSLAYFLWFHLNWLRPQTILLGSTSEDWVERLMRMNRDDVVVAISTGRCVRRTIQIVDLARRRGVRVVGITDSYASALGQRADLTLLIPVQGLSGYETYVPALSLINAMVTSLSLREPEKTAGILRSLESRWEEFHVMASSPVERERRRDMTHKRRPQ